jgi:outer membrane protein
MKIALLCILFVFASNVTKAQKIGHLNSGNIIALMPEAAKADSGLVLYRNDLVAQGDSVSKVFEKEYKTFVEAYNAGTLTQVQVQKRQEELQKMQQMLQNYGQEIETRVQNVRRQLLQPILAKLDEAIQAIGKESGYTIIFDTSNGSTLYAQDSDDVAALVKTKLGLK